MAPAPSAWTLLPHDLVLVSTEKLAHCKLNVAEVTQSEIGQKQKLQTVLEAVQDLLRSHGWPLRWNVDCERPLCGEGALEAITILLSSHLVFSHPTIAPWLKNQCTLLTGSARGQVAEERSGS